MAVWNNAFISLFTRLLLGRQSGVFVLILLSICAIIVTLASLGIIDKSGQIDDIANDIIEHQTGVDLEKVQEKILEKK